MEGNPRVGLGRKWAWEEKGADGAGEWPVLSEGFHKAEVEGIVRVGGLLNSFLKIRKSCRFANKNLI